MATVADRAVDPAVRLETRDAAPVAVVPLTGEPDMVRMVVDAVKVQVRVARRAEERLRVVAGRAEREPLLHGR